MTWLLKIHQMYINIYFKRPWVGLVLLFLHALVLDVGLRGLLLERANTTSAQKGVPKRGIFVAKWGQASPLPRRPCNYCHTWRDASIRTLKIGVCYRMRVFFQVTVLFLASFW